VLFLSKERQLGNAERVDFPVFPVEPGISPIFLLADRFGSKNGEANQTLAH
jgi:hypothetical protein